MCTDTNLSTHTHTRTHTATHTATHPSKTLFLVTHSECVCAHVCVCVRECVSLCVVGVLFVYAWMWMYIKRDVLLCVHKWRNLATACNHSKLQEQTLSGQTL